VVKKGGVHIYIRIACRWIVLVWEALSFRVIAQLLYQSNKGLYYIVGGAGEHEGLSSFCSSSNIVVINKRRMVSAENISGIP
jgi:hypothetical protein